MDEERGFYYGVLNLPDGRRIQLDCETIIGAIPLFAVVVNDPRNSAGFSEYRERFLWLVKNRPDLVSMSSRQKSGRKRENFSLPSRVLKRCGASCPRY